MEEKKKSKVGYFFDLGEVFGYYFKKRDPNKKIDFNLKMMHGMNKISIIVFLLAIIFFVCKKIFT